MTRNFLTVFSIIVLLTSCSSMRSTTATIRPSAPASSKSISESNNKEIKFLDEISSNPQLANSLPEAKTEEKEPTAVTDGAKFAANTTTSSNSSALQQKYAALLETSPSQVQINELIKSVDEWYGTKYRMGGTDRTGIDCSAFVQAVYLTAFGVTIPRTAYEQFRAASRISATEMKQGDLVFFNTTGGVSHVGIYIGNNKFAHASVARGVTVSDLFDPYYLKRFLGIGRIERPTGTR